MQAVILLTLVIITGFLFKREKSPYSRIVIGSVFGIIFFSIWPFTVFYMEIHKSSENYLIFSYSIISIFAIILSLLLIRIKQELTVAIITLLFFFSITIFTISFESEIKNKISIHTGYFEMSPPTSNKVNYTTNMKQRKLFSKHNYTITLNNNWQKKTNKGSQFEYFLLFNGNNKIAEFRPKCFNTGKISLPEIIKNIKHVLQFNNMIVKNHCYQSSNSYYACEVASLDKKEHIKRIRLFALDTEVFFGIELDFLLFENKVSIQKEIDQIIGSAKITGKNNKNYNCLGLTEWM